jgi:light-regulated signal transduction histidine kinase (bacteriophytochrome)
MRPLAIARGSVSAPVRIIDTEPRAAASGARAKRMVSSVQMPDRKRADREEEAAALEAALETERTARALAEERLRRACEDLQEFTSMVAHDLREPLRTVANYCQLVSRKSHESDLGVEDADLLLRFILDGVSRTEALLASMSEYAAAQTARVNPGVIDMNAVFDEALHSLTVREGASVTRDWLPAVIGEFDPLVRVMRHLLDNALKFSGRTDAKVRVSTRAIDGEFEFAVSDNGPGIDPAYRERVFGLFKRLHSREYPGVGLGLPFARLVVESLGGKIWVDSKAGNGATVRFTLLSPEPEDSPAA